MALLQCQFQSRTIGTDAWGLGVTVDIILPDGVEHKPPYKTLYLLHGLSDDQSSWWRNTSIERYAQDYNIAVIMPFVHRSFYADMPNGYRYWSFVSEELTAQVEGILNISAQRSHRFAAGISMGGYGAFQLALRCPQKFAAAASLSGALDLYNIIKRDDLQNEREVAYIFHNDIETLRHSESDLMYLVEKAAKQIDHPPKLYQWCGRQDFLYRDNVEFKAHAQQHGLPLTFEEGDGEHDWPWWDVQIQRVLEWFKQSCGM